MSAITTRGYQRQLQGMLNRLVAQTALSDVTDSSVLKHLLASFAWVGEDLEFQLLALRDVFSVATAVGDDLDARAVEILPGDATRMTATKAVGSVVFSRAGTTGTVNIPLGTVVKTATGVSFQTTAAGSITGGNTASAPVAIIAVVAGAAGNVDADTIVSFASKPAGVQAVTNTANTTSGSDRESDDAFRARIRDYVANLAGATKQALEVAAKTVTLPETGQRVVFAHAVEDLANPPEATLYIDDGAGLAETFEEVASENVTAGLAGPPADSAVGGEERLRLNNWPVRTIGPTAFALSSSSRGALVQGTDYILDDATAWIYFTPPLVAAEVITAAYTHYTGLIAETHDVIYGKSDDATAYPGVRAFGCRVRVRTPGIVVQQVDVNLVIGDGYDQTSVETRVMNAILRYLNNLGISGDVVRNRLIDVIMSEAGVTNLVLNTPSADVNILDDQLVRSSTAVVSIT